MTPELSTERPLWTRNFLLICTSHFFQFFAFYLLVTTLPVFVVDSLAGSQQQAGLTMTVFLISSVLVRPFAGKWVDTFSKKKILFIALCLFFVGSTFYIAVSSFVLLLVLRAFHGLGFGIANTVTPTIAAEMVPEGRKGEGVGYFATFANLAMVVAPFVGLSLITYYNYQVLFSLCIVVALLAFLGGIFVKTEDKVKPAKPKGSGFAWQDYFEVSAISTGIPGFFLGVSYSALATFIFIYAKETGLTEIARYFFIFYAVALLLSRPFVGRLFDQRGAGCIVYPACFLYAIGLFMLSEFRHAYLFLAAGAIIGVGNGSLFSCFQTLVIQKAPKSRGGLATSTYLMLYDLGIGAGAVFFGFIIADTNCQVMYLVDSVIACLIAVLYKLFSTKQRRFQ